MSEEQVKSSKDTVQYLNLRRRKRRKSERLSGETVRNVYRVMVVQHENGSWEVAESERLSSDFATYKKTRQGKWRKLDKRNFAKRVMNTVDYYKTR